MGGDRLLAGRYELVDRLGSGATSTVWTVQPVSGSPGVPLVAKVLKPEYEDKPEVVRRFLREGELAKRVKHSSVVHVSDVLADPPIALIMDRVHGPPLLDYLQTVGGQLSVAEACEVGAQVAEGLAAAHAARVLHLDVKPANVLVEKRPDGLTARLVDFGIAVDLDAAAEDAARGRLGTPGYVAPEIDAGRAPSPKSDVYALAVTVREMLTGSPGVPAEPRRPDVPKKLWSLLDRCTNRVARRRLDAAEVARRLRALRAGPTKTGTPPAPQTVVTDEDPPVAPTWWRRLTRLLLPPPPPASGDGETDVGRPTGPGRAAGWLRRLARRVRALGWLRLTVLTVAAVVCLLLVVMALTRLLPPNGPGPGPGPEASDSPSPELIPSGVPGSTRWTCGAVEEAAGVSYQACVGLDAGRAYGWVTLLTVPDPAGLAVRLELVQVEGNLVRDGLSCPVEPGMRFCGPVDAELGEGTTAVHYVRGAVLRDGEEVPETAQSQECPPYESVTDTEPTSITTLACP